MTCPNNKSRTQPIILEQQVHDCPALTYDRLFNRDVCYLSGTPCAFNNPQSCYRYLEMKRSEIRGVRR